MKMIKNLGRTSHSEFEIVPNVYKCSITLSGCGINVRTV